jgi:hypothetical protein
MSARYWVAAALSVLALGCNKRSQSQGVAGNGYAGSYAAGTGGIGSVSMPQGSGGATQGSGGPAQGTGGMIQVSTGGTGAPGEAGAAASAQAGAAAPAPGTFGSIYTNIIVRAGCNGSSLCHAGPVGMLTMTSKDQAYGALVGVAAMGTNPMMGKGPNCKDSGLMRVVPGKPDESLLVLKVERRQTCGDAMPAASPLDAAKVQEIRAWITAGAKND